MSYMTLSSQQTTISKNNSLTTPFFTLFVLSRVSDNTVSQNIGGADAWAVLPTSNFWGPSPPVSPPLPRRSSGVGSRGGEDALLNCRAAFCLLTMGLVKCGRG